jgi:ketosteroid isomerase-like protein
MYKAAVRALIRHGLARLNAGDPSFLLRLAAPDAELAFPGDNTWASMFRPVHKGLERHATHRGLEECRAFAERFAQAGLTYQIEDILVNGPPWHLRAAVRATDHAGGPDGHPVYTNRLVSFLEMRWGRLKRWEVYEDTERTRDWDRQRTAEAADV